MRPLAQSGTTVLLTTQYLEEADHLTDPIAAIDHGRVIAQGTGEELMARVRSGILHLTLAAAADAPAAARVIAAQGAAAQAGDTHRALSVPLEKAAAALPVLAALAAAGIAVIRFAHDRPTLDAVFFALMGHPAHDEAPTPCPPTPASTRRWRGCRAPRPTPAR